MTANQKLADLFCFIIILSIVFIIDGSPKSGLVLVATASLFGLLRFEKWIEEDKRPWRWEDLIEVKLKEKSALRYFLPRLVVDFIITMTGLFEDQVISGSKTTYRGKREWAPLIIWVSGIILSFYFLE